MGLFDRVSRVIRSNLNALVSSAEDPEKILDQTVEDMREDLVQLRQAVAQSIAAQKRVEQQYNQAERQANKWYENAQLALKKGDENLAREALARRKTHADTAASLKSQVEQLTQQTGTLKRSMTALEGKIAEAKTKKDMLKARAKAAKATEQISKSLGGMDTSSAVSAFERMEEKVLDMEAQSQAVAELAGDSLEDQFAALESSSDLDAEMELLKASLEEPQALPEGTSQQGALPPGDETPVDMPQSELDGELEALRRQLDEPQGS